MNDPLAADGNQYRAHFLAAPSTGFELQQNAGLGTTNWMAVGTATATVGSEKEVIVPGPAGTRFYRLRKP